ncbi:glutathione S-transferase family protein [Hyalangium rubrum]|uniref:Glutathione S-transferase family protein n=1 Tax=Hyalangium rubrum TaxID=3103134 RepID=A0ABU5GVI4_9BACT|nr:glutathione S-transferase family protein [Hyalangium sp. s54d21]MDY7225198.1 glutathione S-transferase family protein [Hyalangium sp. s54d21]
MTSSRHVVFFHAPNSRSAGVRILIEELNAEHELKVLNMKAGETRQADYLAVNPMGKVPAIKHGDALVTEQAAVYMYLAELYPEAGLSPAVGHPLRGPYLRWMVFYGSCFEPALVDRSMKREPAPRGTSPYGDFETVISTLTQQLAKGPWLLGETFTAADVLWGSALTWTTGFKLVPELPEIKAYLERFNARPAVVRARAKDAELAAKQA